MREHAVAHNDWDAWTFMDVKLRRNLHVNTVPGTSCYDLLRVRVVFEVRNMPPKEERVRIGDLVRRTVARIMMAPPETLAAGIQLLEARGNELAAEWSDQIMKQKDPKSLYTAYSAESNMRLQIQRNSRSLMSAYLPVLRSGSIDPLSSTLYLIVAQRVELDFSIEEMLNVFFMLIGLISKEAGGDGAVQDLAVQLTLLTTIIVMEHHRSLTPSAEDEDVLAVTGENDPGMKLSCAEFKKLVKQYEDLNETETVKVPATYTHARTHAYANKHARTHRQWHIHTVTRARTHTHTDTHIRAHTYARAHTHTRHSHTHSHTHTLTQTDTHTRDTRIQTRNRAEGMQHRSHRSAANTRISERVFRIRRRSSKQLERRVSTAPRVQTSSTRGTSSGRER